MEVCIDFILGAFHLLSEGGGGSKIGRRKRIKSAGGISITLPRKALLRSPPPKKKKKKKRAKKGRKILPPPPTERPRGKEKCSPPQADPQICSNIFPATAIAR